MASLGVVQPPPTPQGAKWGWLKPPQGSWGGSASLVWPEGGFSHPKPAGMRVVRSPPRVKPSILFYFFTPWTTEVVRPPPFYSFRGSRTTPKGHEGRSAIPFAKNGVAGHPHFAQRATFIFYFGIIAPLVPVVCHNYFSLPMI
jgi:hypothetical protein